MSEDDAWAVLRAHTGRFEGTGINHEQQAFTGRLELAAVEHGDAVRLRYEATGDDGTVFHAEETRISRDGDELSLGTTSTNHEGLQRFALRRAGPVEDGTALVFGFGARDDTTAYRSEITITVHEAGDVTYAHAWGLPGSVFDDRSAARMQGVNGRR